MYLLSDQSILESWCDSVNFLHVKDKALEQTEKKMTSLVLQPLISYGEVKLCLLLLQAIKKGITMHLYIWKEKLTDLAHLFCVYNPDKIQYLRLGQRERRENSEEDRHMDERYSVSLPTWWKARQRSWLRRVHPELNLGAAVIRHIQ